MVVAAFSVTNQADRIKFFEEIFLVANVSPDVVLGILFFFLSGADVNFPKRELDRDHTLLRKPFLLLSGLS